MFCSPFTSSEPTTRLPNRNLIILSSELKDYYAAVCSVMLHSTDIMIIDQTNIVQSMITQLGDYVWDNIAVIFHGQHDKDANTISIFNRKMSTNIDIMDSDPGFADGMTMLGLFRSHLRNNLHIFACEVGAADGGAKSRKRARGTTAPCACAGSSRRTCPSRTRTSCVSLARASRRLEVRCGAPSKGPEKKKAYVHLLNSTLTATERSLCCLIENWQTPDGLVVPPALRPFMMGIEFVPFVRKLDKKGKLVDVSPPPPPLFTPEHDPAGAAKTAGELIAEMNLGA